MPSLFLRNNIFYYDCSVVDASLARRAGFNFDRASRMWTTRFASVACKAAASPEDRALVVQALVLEKKRMLASGACYSDFQVPVPSGLELMPFQKAGVETMLGRANILLADEMGLGKTIQAIGLCSLIKKPQRPKILIICPASLKINWRREWLKWSTLGLTVGIAAARDFPRSDVVILNYDIAGKLVNDINNRSWDVLILDECHALKNSKAQRTRAILGGRGIQARLKMALSGTPIVNRPIELYNVLHYLDPLTWPNKFDFAKRYCNAQKTRFGWDFTGSSHLDELQTKLRASVMLRRLKSDVLLQLPDKVRQVIELDPTSGAKKALKKEHEWWQTALSQIGVVDSENLTTEEYRQVVMLMGGGLRVAFEDMAAVRRELAEEKVPMVIAHLREALAAGGKVVVFCHHVEMAKALYEEFKAVAVVLTGAANMAARQRAVDQFQNRERVKLFIGNIQAAGTGITLTASAHVVFAEVSWVPGEMTQCEDRTHRIGQKESVLVQYLVAAGSLDAVMSKTIVGKSRVISKAVDLETDPDIAALTK